MNKFYTYLTALTATLILGGFLLYLLITLTTTPIKDDLKEKKPKSSSVIYYPRMYRH